jgi:uncharacterized lipoprotein YddW (UPF0748 family)/N-acetylmuramoyl-L-alanine amidase
MKQWVSRILFLTGLALFAAPALAQQGDGLTLYYYRDGQPVQVQRLGLPQENGRPGATELLATLLAGPTAEETAGGLVSPLPPGAELAAVTVDCDEVTVDLRLSFEFLRTELDASRSDAIVEQIVKTLQPLGLNRFHVRAADESGQFVPISSFLNQPAVQVPAMPANGEPIADRAGSSVNFAGQPPVEGQGRPQGALSGKTVWLSAGHGWYWSGTLSRWNTQRPNCDGIVEDFSNAEAVNYYLARYLWNAGADVWLVRERGMTPYEVIVDNDSGAPGYVETGSWSVSETPGYNGGEYRWASTFSTLTARATWTPDLPAAGWYPVWVWYRHGENRSSDARYEVHHAGGVTTVPISQEVHGMTWRYLGEYYFQAGRAGYVTLLNASDDSGQVVVADAVRFGAGMGSIAEPGGTSGEPRWEESAQYWARYEGAPEEVYGNDVTARPLYAEWESAKGYPDEAENAVYISWHTNAGGGSGTYSYIHDSEPTPGSAQLQDWIHAELVHDLRAEWDPGWHDGGQRAADFGELRALSKIPGVLLEVAFHDTEDPGDADDLREPLFRQIAARAVFQGIVKYYASRDDKQAALLPEPPQRTVARNSAPAAVTVRWAAPACCDGAAGDVATSYKVYHSTNGRGFDNGVETASTSFSMSGLAPGSLHYFRVTALNAGGESFPTPVVAVRTPLGGSTAAFLIVDGFDRLDQSALIPQWESPALGTARRMFLERMNSYDYAVEHAESLSNCDLSFDGAVDETVAAGDVALGAYLAVDWFAGENAGAEAALSDAERAALAVYLDGGGRLLISGAEIGYDLVENGRDPTFYHDYLRAGYAGDDAGTYTFSGVSGGPFEGPAGRFDNSTFGTYDVGSPDRLDSTAGSSVAMTYVGGAGGGAALTYAGGYRLVYFGFPLETVTDRATRTELFCAAVDYLLPEGIPEPAPLIVRTPRIIDAGFEGGVSQSAWQMASPGGVPIPTSRASLPDGIAPHGGDWLAWLRPAITGTSALTQTVALPSGEPTVTLSLTWLANGETPSPPAADTLAAGIYDLTGTLQTQLFTTAGRPPTGTWQIGEFDLSNFSGQTVQLAFHASTTATDFFLDDVQLNTFGLPGPDEFRALWVDAYHPGAKSRQQIDELIETAQAGSFNALVVQVRRRGDTYYPSDIDPWAPDANPDFDVLAYLIQRAHAAGIEVHAWMTALAIWNDDTPPAAPDHTFNLHGPGASGRDYWITTGYPGDREPSDHQYYLDPGHPDVVDYTLDVVAELVSRYDLDGLHLDRIRFPGAEWGYNPTSLARFQAEAGREGEVPEPTDPEWAQWRRDQVTALVRRIYRTATAIKPRLRVTAAVSAAGSAPWDDASWQAGVPYSAHFQDWLGWLEEGILDLAMPMTYRREFKPEQAADFDDWIAWQKDHQYGRGVVIGTALYLNELRDSMDQWHEVLEPTLAGNRALGVVGYSYATLSNADTTRRAFVNAVVTEVFTRPASLPPMPWKHDARVYLPLVVRQTRP